MQPTYVKLKLPEKALRALILLIMLSLQQCSSGYGQKICFDPVWKTRVYNAENGFVSVNPKTKQIYTNSSSEPFLYKISTTSKVKFRHNQTVETRSAFYLFEPNTQRFLCWKNFNGSMIAMTYEAIQKRNHWKFCKFFDLSPNEHQGESATSAYVKLHLAGHPEMVMQFDRKGRNVSPKRVERCLMRLSNNKNAKQRHAGVKHKNRCIASPMHMMYWSNLDNVDMDCCGEAYEALCRGKTRRMYELKDKCAEARSKCEIRGNLRKFLD